MVQILHLRINILFQLQLFLNKNKNI